jgi:LysR family nitrogen assimilation transcriptional regulator
MTISLRQLRYFAKVVETGNITRASEQLNIAQTALGLQIRNLEEDLGAKLLLRHSRGIATTDAGRLLYERAVEILRQVDETRRDVFTLGGVRKETVTLGVTPSILRLIGSELIVTARERLPNVSLHVVEELSFVQAGALERQELDFALAYEVTDRPGLERVALIEERLLYVTAAGPDAGTGPIPFKDAIVTELALASSRDIVWQLVHAVAERLSLPVNVAFEVQSVQAIKTLVARGVATSVIPYGIVAEEIRQGLIVGRPVESPALTRTLFLAWHSQTRHLADKAAFLAFLGDIAVRLKEQIGPLATLIRGPEPMASIAGDTARAPLAGAGGELIDMPALRRAAAR